jgi:hypothetical protein
MDPFNEPQRETAEAPTIPKFEVEFALENFVVSLFMLNGSTGGKTLAVR